MSLCVWEVHSPVVGLFVRVFSLCVTVFSHCVTVFSLSVGSSCPAVALYFVGPVCSVVLFLLGRCALSLVFLLGRRAKFCSILYWAGVPCLFGRFGPACPVSLSFVLGQRACYSLVLGRRARLFNCRPLCRDFFCVLFI